MLKLDEFEIVSSQIDFLNEKIDESFADTSGEISLEEAQEKARLLRRKYELLKYLRSKSQSSNVSLSIQCTPTCAP